MRAEQARNRTCKVYGPRSWPRQGDRLELARYGWVTVESDKPYCGILIDGKQHYIVTVKLDHPIGKGADRFDRIEAIV